MDDLQERLQENLPQRYLLERELARGGMGTVWLAREQHPNRMVAIKVLHPHLTANLTRKRFLREIDHTSKLTHPHIVPVFAAGEAGDLLFYVMPYVRGESLAGRLVRERPLPIDQALRIAREVASALAYAHEQGVLHRDIKPGNILLHDEHAFVTDFGVSRAMTVAGTDSLTETGIAIGTPSYMSPEQAQAEVEIDGRADIYALGCVLYEMLAGEPPFQGRDVRTIMARQLVDPVPSLRAVRDTVPPAVEQVINVALAKTPADRFSTAKQFAQALVTAQGDPASSWTTPLPAAAQKSGGRTNVRRWAKDAVFAAIVVVLALLAWQPWRANNPAAAAGTGYRDSLAIIPLDNLTGDSQYDYLAAGITEEIYTQLSKIPDLKVTYPRSAEILQSRGLLIPQIAESLRVRHVVQGSLRLDRERVRVSVHHLNAETDATLWSETFTGDLGDVFRVEENIARLASDRVASTISGVDPPGPERRTESALGPGHEEHLLGQRWLARRTPEGLARAITWFEQALQQDSGYARALADLSTAHALSLTYRYELGLGGYEAARLALSLADRAIEADRNLAAGYAARGYIRALSNAPVADVANDFERARQLQPNAPSVPRWSARVLAMTGQLDSALAETRRAVDLDPYSAFPRIAVSLWSLQTGRYAESIEQAERAIALEPDLMLPRAIKARALLLTGQSQQCAQMDLGPHAVIRAMCLRQLGSHAEAAALVDSVKLEVGSASRRDTVFSDVTRVEDLASFYARAGDAAEALGWLERAYQLSPSGVETWVLESALFDPVRNDPQFRTGIERVRARIWRRVTTGGGR
jgi:serine/threonine-protein kinase